MIGAVAQGNDLSEGRSAAVRFFMDTRWPRFPKGHCLAYLRVSTPKQGEGVTLLTQREEIARFSKSRDLLVNDWYEEEMGRPQRPSGLQGDPEEAASSGRQVRAQGVRLPGGVGGRPEIVSG